MQADSDEESIPPRPNLGKPWSSRRQRGLNESNQTMGGPALRVRVAVVPRNWPEEEMRQTIKIRMTDQQHKNCEPVLSKKGHRAFAVHFWRKKYKSSPLAVRSRNEPTRKKTHPWMDPYVPKDAHNVVREDFKALLSQETRMLTNVQGTGDGWGELSIEILGVQKKSVVFQGYQNGPKEIERVSQEAIICFAFLGAMKRRRLHRPQASPFCAWSATLTIRKRSSCVTRQPDGRLAWFELRHTRLIACLVWSPHLRQVPDRYRETWIASIHWFVLGLANTMNDSTASRSWPRTCSWSSKRSWTEASLIVWRNNSNCAGNGHKHLPAGRVQRQILRPGLERTTLSAGEVEYCYALAWHPRRPTRERSFSTISSWRLTSVDKVVKPLDISTARLEDSRLVCVRTYSREILFIRPKFGSHMWTFFLAWGS